MSNIRSRLKVIDSLIELDEIYLKIEAGYIRSAEEILKLNVHRGFCKFFEGSTSGELYELGKDLRRERSPYWYPVLTVEVGYPTGGEKTRIYKKESLDKCIKPRAEHVARTIDRLIKELEEYPRWRINLTNLIIKIEDRLSGKKKHKRE